MNDKSKGKSRLIYMSHLLFGLTGTLTLQAAENAATQAVPSMHPQLRYHPEGEAIVCQNGGSDFTE